MTRTLRHLGVPVILVLALAGCLETTPSQTCPLPPVATNAEPPGPSPDPDWRPSSTTVPTGFDGVTLQTRHQAHVLVSNGQAQREQDPNIAAEHHQRPIGPPRQLLP